MVSWQLINNLKNYMTIFSTINLMIVQKPDFEMNFERKYEI